MVSNKFLASLAVKLGFHKHLRKNGTGIVNAIQTFVGDIIAADTGSVDFWVNISDSIPKVSLPHTPLCNWSYRLTPVLTPR